MKNTLLFILASVLWIPYYIYGVKYGVEFLQKGKWFTSSLIVTVTVLIGFIGLHLIQKYFLPSDFSTATFRLLLILSTQIMAVVLIAVDSKFNWLAILAGLLVLSGAVIGSFAVK